MRISKKLVALGAFFVIAALVAGCGSSVPGNSVASMAGNPITKQAYDHWMYVAAKQAAEEEAEEGEEEPVITPNDPPEFTSCIKQIRAQITSLATTSAKTLRSDCKEVFSQYNSQVMDYLIEAYWYQAQAAKQGVTYTTAQLNKEFAKLKKAEFPKASEFKTYLSESGETEADLKFQIRVQELYTKLVKKAEKKVSSAAVKSYYDTHKSTYGTPEKRDLHLIRMKTQAKAQAAYNALKSGSSWDTVAKQYAADASSQKNGGVLTGVTSGEEEKAVNKVIFASPVNKLEGPIKGLFGYYVVEVTKITAATQETLSQATKTIKSTLTKSSETKAEAVVNKAVSKNFKPKTTCRSTFAVADCTGYKAPKTTTTATTTPTTTPTVTTTTGTTTTGTTTGTSGATSTATTTTPTSTSSTTVTTG